jgi:site-specific recombinase XerD
VILLLMLETGIRVSALRGIRVEDVDLRDRRLRVIEKGRRERVVPFEFQAFRWLRRYLVAARLGEDSFLFPGRDGRPLSRKRIDEIVKACAAKAGVRRGRCPPTTSAAPSLASSSATAATSNLCASS